MQTPPLSPEKLESETISFLRFPLMVAVVFIHTIFPTSEIALEHTPLFTGVYTLCAQIVARMAVPLFFLFSGYLFFRHTDTFTFDCYKSKLVKRSRTLLVPYLFWNAAILFFYFVVQQAGLSSGRYKPIIDYAPTEWLLAFWNMPTADGSTSAPIDYPLWFLRDLMVIVLLSPIVHAVVKRLHLYVLVPVVLLWICNCETGIQGLSTTVICFFSLGAYFALRRQHFVRIMQRLLPVALPLYIVMAIVELFSTGSSYVTYLHNTGILVGIVALVGLTARRLEQGRWKIRRRLSDSSFFLFAYHAIPLSLLIKICLNLLHPHTEAALIALYFIIPAIIVAAGVALYALLKKYLPTITALITGGR